MFVIIIGGRGSRGGVPGCIEGRRVWRRGSGERTRPILAKRGPASHYTLEIPP